MRWSIDVFIKGLTDDCPASWKVAVSCYLCSGIDSLCSISSRPSFCRTLNLTSWGRPPRVNLGITWKTWRPIVCFRKNIYLTITSLQTLLWTLLDHKGMRLTETFGGVFLILCVTMTTLSQKTLKTEVCLCIKSGLIAPKRVIRYVQS